MIETTKNLVINSPKKMWLHILAVAGTIIVAFSMLLLGLPLSKLFNIELSEMAADNFSLSLAKVFLFLLLTVLYFVVIYSSQRFIHKAPFRLLGFRKPNVRHILVSFIIGATISLIPFLIIILVAKNMVYASAIPEGIPLIRVIATYLFFFFIWLTANSIGEELVYRCYAIEQFIDNRKYLPYVILGAAIVFALLHFFVREASLSRFFMLSLTSIFYSMIYLNWRSIWTLVGIHNGMNFANLSFSENWEMGGLFTWNGDPVLWLGKYINFYHYAVPVIAILLLFLYYRRSNQKAGSNGQH